MSLDIYNSIDILEKTTKLAACHYDDANHGWQSFAYATVGTRIYLFGGYNSTSFSNSYIAYERYYFDTVSQTFTMIGGAI